MKAESDRSGRTVRAPGLIGEAGRNLARLSRIVEKACQDSGLSLPQYRLLVFVARRPQRAGELATRSAVSRPALTDLVDGLERLGFIRRAPVEGDRRGISLELTSKGSKAVAETERALAGRLQTVLDTDLVERLAELGPVLDRDLDAQVKRKD